MDQQVTLRLPADLLVKIDGHLGTLRDRTSLCSLTRSDAIRDLVARGLETVQPPISRTGS